MQLGGGLFWFGLFSCDQATVNYHTVWAAVSQTGLCSWLVWSQMVEHRDCTQLGRPLLQYNLSTSFPALFMTREGRSFGSVERNVECSLAFMKYLTTIEIGRNVNVLGCFFFGGGGQTLVFI